MNTNVEEIEKYLSNIFNTMHRTWTSRISGVTGKGGMLLMHEAIREYAGLPPLTEEEKAKSLRRSRDGMYSLQTRKFLGYYAEEGLPEGDMLVWNVETRRYYVDRCKDGWVSQLGEFKDSEMLDVILKEEEPMRSNMRGAYEQSLITRMSILREELVD